MSTQKLKAQDSCPSLPIEVQELAVVRPQVCRCASRGGPHGTAERREETLQGPQEWPRWDKRRMAGGADAGLIWGGSIWSRSLQDPILIVLWWHCDRISIGSCYRRVHSRRICSQPGRRPSSTPCIPCTVWLNMCMTISTLQSNFGQTMDVVWHTTLRDGLRSKEVLVAVSELGSQSMKHRSAPKEKSP